MAMGAAKVSSAPSAKKPITKKSRSSKPVQSSLSKEFVEDSDDPEEDGKEQNRSKPKSSKIFAVKSVSSEDKPSNIDSSKKRKISSLDHPKSTLNGDASIRNSQKQTTREKDSENGDSSQDSSPAPVEQGSGANVTAQRKPKKMSDNTVRPESCGQVSSGKKKGESQEPDSESSIESNDSEDSKSDSKSESSRSSSVGSPDPQLKEKSEPPPSPFQPPKGFEISAVPSQKSSRVSELFAQSNLRGKQVWHITVPASVSITSINEVSLHDIQNGTSVLSHESANYGFISGEDVKRENKQSLLLPSFQANDYRPANVSITKTLHLQQLMSLPNRAQEPPSDSNTAQQRPETHVEVPRQQPQGLKMRYHPFGVSEDLESLPSPSDPTDAPQCDTQEFAEGSPTKKRKRTVDTNVDPGANSSPKKKKQKAQSKVRHSVEDPAVKGTSEWNGALAKDSSPIEDHQVNVANNTVNGIGRNKPRVEPDPIQTEQTLHATAVPILPSDVTKEAETIMPGEVVSNDVGINKISPKKHSKEEKFRRKEEKRKRKEKENEKEKEKKLATTYKES